MAQQSSHVETRMLDSGWHLRQYVKHHQDEHPWLPVEKIPSEVHLELMRHGKIPDPFVVEGSLGSDELEPFVIHAVLFVCNKQVSYDISWPEPIKYLDFTDRGVEVRDVGDSMVEISAQKPVKGFVFAERQGMKLSDNGLDLVPGKEPRRVHIEVSDENLKVDELAWTFVGR